MDSPSLVKQAKLAKQYKPEMNPPGFLPTPDTPTNKPASAEPLSVTGPKAIELALAKLNLEQLGENARKRMKVKSHRAKAVKVLNAIEGIKRNNLTPDQYMISKVPVIPPSFRPFAVQGSTFIPGDANELYRDLVKVRDGCNQEAETCGAAERDTFDTLYGAARAVYG